MQDILIIGSGPAGLSAAIYAARARLSATVLEKDLMGSGAIAVTERVDNYPGLPGVSGYDLGEKFRAHAESLGARIKTAEAVEIKNAENAFVVRTKDGQTLEAKTVIYAAGTSYRRLGIPGAALLGVSYCATCDGAFYEGKTVAVIGGGDTALTDALYLAKIAEKVYLFHRRDRFRANPTLVESVKNTGNIEPVMCAKPVRILGERSVEALAVARSDQENILKLSGVFAAIGSVPNTEILRGSVELDSDGYIVSDEKGRTSLKGFFAAGDVRSGAFRQVITAAADGAVCVNSVEEYLL